MSSVLIEHNRRAVYSALIATCKERSLLEQAFAYWETHFAGSVTFRVSQYVDALVGHVGLSQEQRRELSVGLYSALGKPDNALAVVPTVLRRGGEPATPTVATNSAKSAPTDAPKAGVIAKSAGAVVLADLVAQLVDGAARARQSDELAQSANFADAALAQPTKRVANQWVRGGFSEPQAFANLVPDDERQTVVSVIYVALCEAVGPANADRILGQAVQHAEKLPEAIEFSPRQLL